MGDREWFERAVHTHGFSVSDYQIGPISGKGTVFLAHPSFDDAGKLKALVFAGLNLDWLHQIAASVNLPEQATLTVFSQTGTILDRYPDPERWVVKSLPEVPIITRGSG